MINADNDTVGETNMTLKQARAILKTHGITIQKVGGSDDYRVNVANGSEATACYETDIEAAVGTGVAMAREIRAELISEMHATTPSIDRSKFEALCVDYSTTQLRAALAGLIAEGAS